MTAATIKPTLHHATFKTTRLQEMIDWYTKVVGIEVNFQFPGGAWTSNDRANHRLRSWRFRACARTPTRSSIRGCIIRRSNTTPSPT